MFSNYHRFAANSASLIQIAAISWAITPSTGTFWRQIPERPRKRSESVSWNSPQEYGWDPPSPIIQAIWSLQSISRILSPSVLGTPLVSDAVPKRASQSWSGNISSNTEGISDLKRQKRNTKVRTAVLPGKITVPGKGRGKRG